MAKADIDARRSISQSGLKNAIRCDLILFLLRASTFDPPPPFRMVHIVHKSTGNSTPTHDIPTHSQRRLFELGHLLRVYRLI